MQQESIQIKLVGKVRPQHLPKDEVGTTNSIIAKNVNNIFAVVNDLAEVDNPLSDAERKRAITEITNHANLSRNVKSATIEALKICKTVSQKRGIMSKARFGGTAQEISSLVHNSLTRTSSQRSLEKVRSLVKMVGQYRKAEHEAELEELLVKREKDLDVALQQSDLYRKLYEDAALSVSGFCEVDVDSRDDAVSEIQLAQNCIEDDVRIAAEEALLRAGTRYEMTAIMCEAMVHGSSGDDVRRVAKKTRLDAQPVNKQESSTLKEEIEANSNISQEQKKAAFEALQLCKVTRQLEELRDSIFHHLPPSKITDSCLVLSELDTKMHGLRSELQQARENMFEMLSRTDDVSEQAVAWEKKTQQHAEALKKSKREWERKLKKEEDRTEDQTKNFSREKAQREQIQLQLEQTKRTLEIERGEADKSSKVLSGEAVAMNVRLKTLMESVSGMTGALSSEQRQVRAATSTLEAVMQDHRKTNNELSAMKGRANVTNDELSDLHKQIRSLVEKTRLQEGDMEALEKKLVLSSQKTTDMENKLKETGETLEVLRQTVDKKDEALGMLKNDHSVAVQTIARQETNLQEQAAELSTTQQEVEALQNKKQELQENLNGELRTLKVQVENARQQQVLSEQALEHEKARHEKQTASSQEAYKSKLKLFEQETGRKHQNKLKDMQVSLEQAVLLKTQLSTSLNTTREALMEMEDTMSTVQSENSEMSTKMKSWKEEREERAVQLLKFTTSDTEQKASILSLEDEKLQLTRVNAETKHLFEKKQHETMSQLQAAQSDIEKLTQQHNQLVEEMREQYKRDQEAAQVQYERDSQKALQNLENQNASLQQNIEQTKVQQERDATTIAGQHHHAIVLLQSELEDAKSSHLLEMETTDGRHAQKMENAKSNYAADLDRKTKELQSKILMLTQEAKDSKEDRDRELLALQSRIDKDKERHSKSLHAAKVEHDRVVDEKNSRMQQLERSSEENIRKSKKDRSEMTSRLTELEIRCTDAERDQKSSERQLTPLNEQIQQQQRDLSRLKDALSEASGKIGDLQGKLDGSKQQFAGISQKHEAARRESDRVKTSLREIQSVAEELRTEVSSLNSQVSEIPVHEAEVERLRRRIEEGSNKQNAVIRDLQSRAHAAESKAGRAEERIVEENTRSKMEISRIKQELTTRNRISESMEQEAEERMRNLEDEHVRALSDTQEKIRSLQSEIESTHRSMETLRDSHHAQILELQDRMTVEAEQYLTQARQHSEAEVASLKRTASNIQREAEEMSKRQEQSWLTERSYLRNEVETSRTVAANAQKKQQHVMLELERQIIDTEKVKSELRAEREAHTETNAALSEMRTVSVVVDAERMKVRRLENELRSAEQTVTRVQQLEMQLADTESLLEETTTQKLQFETRLASENNTSRVEQLREKVERLRDAVSNDSSGNGNGSSSSSGGSGYNSDNLLENTSSSHSAILEALSSDHSRALSSNGELRRELAREQEACAAANKRLYSEREITSNKIKQLTTILRQAQDAWDHERRDILDSKRKSEQAKHEFESAAKLYSRISKDATNERDNALQELEDSGKRLLQKTTELSETRSKMLSLRDENLSLSHQTNLLKSEVTKITHVTARKKRSMYELNEELSNATNEFAGDLSSSKSVESRSSRALDTAQYRPTYYTRSETKQANSSVDARGASFPEKAGSGPYGVREADEEIAAMRNFFRSQRSEIDSTRSHSSRSLAEEADRIAWDVRKRSVGEDKEII